MTADLFYRIFAQRLACMLATFWLADTLFDNTWLYGTAVVLVAVGLAQAVALARWTARGYRNLTCMVEAIHCGDVSPSFAGDGARSLFPDLSAALSGVMEIFRQARLEREQADLGFEDIFQRVGVGMFCYGQDGLVTLVNSAARKLLGIAGLFRIQDLAAVDPRLLQALQVLNTGHRALVKVHAAGRDLALSLEAVAVRIRGQSLTLVSLHDIRHELAVREMEIWRDVVRTVAHEVSKILSPATNLAAEVRALLPPALPSGIARDVALIESSGRTLLRFVESQRNLLRAPSPDFQTVSVRDLLDRVKRLVGTTIGPEDIAVTVRVDPESLTIGADAGMIGQVLDNLVINAVQALSGRPGARIELSARTDGRGSAVIDIIDNGPGIPLHLQEDVFTPLFTTKEDGAGIGLSLSREIMSLHHGSLTLTSEPGVRTVFTLRF